MIADFLKRFARVLGLVALAVVVIAGIDVTHAVSSMPGRSGDGVQYQPGPVYEYPTPSYWPTSPYPVASASVQLTPQVTISPCPTWAPTLVHRPDGIYECKAFIPPDPGGPVLASPSPST